MRSGAFNEFFFDPLLRRSLVGPDSRQPPGQPRLLGASAGAAPGAASGGGKQRGSGGGGGPPREDGQGLGTQPLLSACSPFLQLWEESLFQPRPGKDVGARGVPLESAPL